LGEEVGEGEGRGKRRNAVNSLLLSSIWGEGSQKKGASRREKGKGKNEKITFLLHLYNSEKEAKSAGKEGERKKRTGRGNSLSVLGGKEK